MKKPESLKALLLKTVPGLADNPESLQLFVDKGQIYGGNGRSLSFEYRYSLNVVIEAFAGDVDAITVPVLAWLAANQGELLAKPDAQPFQFEAEILDSQSADVSITMDLTEPVIVTPRDGGGYTVDHPAAAAGIAASDVFAGVIPRADWSLLLNGELVASGSAS